VKMIDQNRVIIFIDETISSDMVYYPQEPLSDTQYMVLWGLGCLSCALSWFGSFSIIYISRRKLQSLNHRLLCIVSCIDLVSSPWGVLNPVLMNAETGIKFSRGNRGTCTSVGFMTMFSIVSKAFYSCYIAMYFMLSVRYKLSDRQVKRYEISAYLIAFVVPMTYGVIGFITEVFNPNEFRYCAIAKYPIGCKSNECIRGNFARTLVDSRVLAP
jgi:hypothetical protein